MTAKRLNIGLIGSGFMGQAHADAYRRAGVLYRDLPAKPRLFMLADANDALAQSAASRFGFEKSTGDWRKLVADPDVDVVDITSPNLMHSEMALAAIAAGKHVYCEKPLAVTLTEAEAMAAAAKKAGVKTMVAFNNIKTPAAMLAKQIIARGEIGTPMRFRGWFDQGFYNDPDLPFSWRLTRKEAGSGALGDLGSHVISVAQYLMGEAESVVAAEQTFFPTRPVPQGGSGYAAKAGADAPRAVVENEDQIQALVRFKSGAGGVNRSFARRRRQGVRRLLGGLGNQGHDHHGWRALQRTEDRPLRRPEARPRLQDALRRQPSAAIFRLLRFRFRRRRPWLFRRQGHRGARPHRRRLQRPRLLPQLRIRARQPAHHRRDRAITRDKGWVPVAGT